MKTKNVFAAMVAAMLVTVGSVPAFAGNIVKTVALDGSTPATVTTSNGPTAEAINAAVNAAYTGVDMYPDITVYNSGDALTQAAAAKDYGKVFELHKAALKKYYSQQPALTVPYKEYETGFYYNAPQGAVGKSEVHAFTNVADGSFMKVYIAGDWSDDADAIYSLLAANPASPNKESWLSSVDYYTNLPNVVYITLVEFLGQNEGTNFFCHMKSYADIYNSADWATTGIAGQNIPLTNWALRTTDYGMAYSIDHDYDGFVITLYY